ncbi:MAG: ferrous iron transport protein B [Methanomassiliicoccales archaeon]|jgi:ferrous iron transport protein B|nr:ferrous iron transport protein B [Methanomassiliicoccales archaeon]
MHVALIGNPNVGKSVLFSRITGIGVISSNYPGTTVEFEEGRITYRGETIVFYDLPGTYSLSGTSEDELVATKLLAEKKLDVVVAVADATRLVQSLVLIFQLIELGYRVVVALNFMDIARRRYRIDVEKLANILEIPVVPTVAITGEGVDELIGIIAEREFSRSGFVVRYDAHIENIIEKLSGDVVEWQQPFPLRGALLKLLEGNEQFAQLFTRQIRENAEEFRKKFNEEHHESIDVHIARDRYGEAGRIVSEVTGKLETHESLGDRISRLTLTPLSGIAILLSILALVFFTIVYIGGAIESGLGDAYQYIVGGFFDRLAELIGGNAGVAISRGIDLSLQAILSIVIPYILVFYLILGILEDSGYLPRAVTLLDGVMHKIGLHGRAIIPMIVGVGCNVPAILATRVLESRRERLILATLTIMCIPCSAQLAIIFGVVGHFGGLIYAVMIFVILFSILLLLGRLLHVFLRFEPSTIAIEIPDLTIPSPRNVLYKTYIRVKDFFIVAFPILFVGSLILELLIEFGILNKLVEPLSIFTVGLLGLPAITIIALIFGVLRKEMAFQLLVVLFGTTNLATVFSPAQLFVFGLVMATYMPCLSALAVLLREFGAKDAITITISSLTLSLTLGTIANLIFNLV